jgi:UDP-glucose 4-epimerase
MRRLRSALVTGATGFLGSVLVDRLLADGVEVTALVRSDSRRLHRLSRPGLRVVEVDSWDAATLPARLMDVRADVLFHLASYGVHQDQREPGKMIDGNVGLVATLLQIAAQLQLGLFIHTGSCSEYGIPERQGCPIAETEALRPVSLYGAAKAAAGVFGGILASQLGVPFVALRLFGVYGPHESAERLMPYLIRHLEADSPVDLTLGGQVRDLLFEDDVADAFVTVAKSEEIQLYNTYNVCSSVPVRIREVGEQIADEMGKPRDLLHWGDRPYRSDEPMWLVGDLQKFAKATAWRPTTSWRDGVSLMVAHARSAGGEVNG